MNPLLSIVVPTKNRYEYLTCLVDYFTSNQDKRIELIIQDNSDNQDKFILDKLENIGDNRIKYFYHSEHISVIDNCDKAIVNSTGDYVTMIGDDDWIMPYIIDITTWMKTNNYDGLKAYKPFYYWPHQKPNYLSNDLSGRLVLKKNEIKLNSRKINLQKEFDCLLKKGGVSTGMIPSVYHGIIKRASLNDIYKGVGTFFPGPSPDMSNAVALVEYLNNPIFIDFPVVVSGKCNKSTGGKGTNHMHIDKIENVKHLPAETLSEWDDLIPKYWTGPTIWAQSVSACIKKIDGKIVNKNAKINYQYLYGKLIVFNWKQRSILFKKPFRGLRIDKTLFWAVVIFFARTKNLINYRLPFNVKKFNNIRNTYEAVEKTLGIINGNDVRKYIGISSK